MAEQDSPKQGTAMERLTELHRQLTARNAVLERALADNEVQVEESPPTADLLKDAIVSRSDPDPSTGKVKAVVDIRKLPKSEAMWLVKKVRTAQRKRILQALGAVETKLAQMRENLTKDAKMDEDSNNEN